MMIDPTQIPPGFSWKHHLRGRLLVVAVVLGLGWAGIVVRLVTLQVVDRDRLEATSRKQYERFERIEARRGTIYDRNYRALALSVQTHSIFCEPNRMTDAEREAAAEGLATVLNRSASSLAGRFDPARSFTWVARHLSPETWKAVQALKLKGVRHVAEWKRQYPFGICAGQILGFVGSEHKGLAGLESQYESALAGIPGLLKVDQDNKKRRLAAGAEVVQEPQDGQDLILNLDAVLQFFAERALQQAVDEEQAKGGALILLAPHTGEVLAMASAPAFDPATYRTANPEAIRNRAVNWLYEPGSTLKIVPVAGIFDRNLRSEEDSFEAGGRTLTVAKTLINSDNEGIAALSRELGTLDCYRLLELFGFGVLTGIDFPGEEKGLLRPLKSWSGLTLASIAMGQEIAATPLQVAQAFAVTANGGMLVEPSLSRKLLGSRGELILERKPAYRARVITPETAARLASLLERVVADGTGIKAAIPGYRVAGKTGTGQKFDGTFGRYSHQRLVTSFAGFAPVEDPRLVCLVVLDEPQINPWGGTSAAPVFRKVVEESLKYLGVAGGEKKRNP